MACDLFSGFKSAADTLEDAIVVADVFHLVRLGLTALDEVRRRMQQEIHGHRGHKSDPLFRLRRMLRVGQERLDPGTIDEQVAVLRERRLDHVEFPYVFLVGTYVKARVNRQVVSRAMVIATDMAADGNRETLGVDVGAREDELLRTSFLRSLKDRGLAGVQLVISDAHAAVRNG